MQRKYGKVLITNHFKCM